MRGPARRFDSDGVMKDERDIKEGGCLSTLPPAPSPPPFVEPRRTPPSLSPIAHGPCLSKIALLRRKIPQAETEHRAQGDAENGAAGQDGGAMTAPGWEGGGGGGHVSPSLDLVNQEVELFPVRIGQFLHALDGLVHEHALPRTPRPQKLSGHPRTVPRPRWPAATALSLTIISPPFDS